MTTSTSFAQMANNQSISLSSALRANTPPTKEQTTSRKFLTLSIFLLLSFFTTNAWGAKVTYTVSSISAVTTSETAPDGSSADYSSTYGTKCQLTSGNSMTLTLSGYKGCTITGLTLSMRSNAEKGAGNMSMKIGSTTVASISTAKFNTSSWNGSWSTSYVNVTPSVTATTVGNGEKIVITIAATANSLYCQSFTLTYTPAGGGGDSGNTNCLTLSATSNYPFNSTSSSNTSVYSTTIDGITFENKGGYKYDNSYLSFNKSLSGAYIANTTPFSGNIESIVVDYYSGGSSYFDMYEGSASKPSSTVVSPSKTGTGSVTYTFSGNNPYFNLALKTTGTYCNINSITICYSNTPASSFTITAQSNNTNYGTVLLSETTITASPETGYRVKSGDAGYTVTSGTADVINNGDNTFSVTPSSDCTITINFEAIPKYTVTWKVNGIDYTVGEPTTQVYDGGKVTKLPTAPDPANNCGEVFAGWTTIPIDGTTNAKPSVLFTTAANSPDIKEPTTFYAVFADYAD